MLNLSDIEYAWKYIYTKKSAGGIDLIDIDEFARNSKSLCKEIYTDLIQQHNKFKEKLNNKKHKKTFANHKIRNKTQNICEKLKIAL